MSGSTLTKALKFCDAQCLPVGLVSATLFGLAAPSLGVEASKLGWLAKACVPLIFFIAGLKLKTDEAKKALQAHKAIVIGMTSMLLLTCITGSTIVSYLPIQPPEFKTGLILFFCMPCTISSGGVLTKQAGGNFALALLLTVAGNSIGILTAPTILSFFVDNSGVELPVGDIMYKLALSVMLPMACGKGVQELPWRDRYFAKLASANNKTLTMTSNAALILIPWMKISDTVAEGSFAKTTFWDLVVVCIATAAVHCGFLGMNWLLSTFAQLEEPIQKAVIFVCSTKTLPVALTVLTLLPEDVTGDQGLVAIPPILSHLIQTVIDGFLATHWKRRSDESERQAADAAAAGGGGGAGGEGGAGGGGTGMGEEMTASMSGNAAPLEGGNPVKEGEGDGEGGGVGGAGGERNV